MLKEERLKALKELARIHKNAKEIHGQLWKNPLNSKSKGIRWTQQDLELFKKFQKEFLK